MKMKNKVLCVVLGVFAVVGTAVAYGGKHYGSEKHMDRIFEKVTKKLSLDDAQQEKLSIAKTAALALHKAIREDKQAIQDDILSLVASDTMDQELVLKHVNAKADAVRDQAPAVVAAVADFYDSLNAEQQAQIRSKVEKKIERMRDRHSK